MIIYTRTIKQGVKYLADAFKADVPYMAYKSMVSYKELRTFSEAERIIYNLDRWEMWYEIPHVVATHIVVVPAQYAHEVEICMAVNEIKGLRWKSLEYSHSKSYNWAYQSQKGEILFKIGRARNFKVFKPQNQFT